MDDEWRTLVENQRAGTEAKNRRGKDTRWYVYAVFKANDIAVYGLPSDQAA